MPPPPGMSAEEYAARKARQAEEMKAAKEAKAKQEAEKKAASEARAKYQKKADPTTVEDMLNAETLGQEWFKEGEWRAGWANVEFDGDACLKNVTKAGKEKDGYFAPAGTILPLGAALPHMTVLKYGGYFPPGTSFPGGVMIPLHARMVNLLPQKTDVPGSEPEESLCVIQ